MPLLFMLLLSSWIWFAPSLLAQAPTTPTLRLAVNSDHQWGAQDADQAWAIPPIYDTLYPLPRTRFDHETYEVHYVPSAYWLGKRNDKQVVLMTDGTVLCKADAILPRLMGDAVLLRKGTQWGLKVLQGKTLLPTRCTEIAWYGDVLGLKYQGQWHLFDAQEGYLYPKGGFDAVQLHQVSPRHRLLLVQRGDKWGVLNDRLVLVLPLAYDSIRLQPTDTPIQHLSQVQFIIKGKEGHGLLNLMGEFTPMP